MEFQLPKLVHVSPEQWPATPDEIEVGFICGWRWMIGLVNWQKWLSVWLIRELTSKLQTPHEDKPASLILTASNQ